MPSKCELLEFIVSGHSSHGLITIQYRYTGYKRTRKSTGVSQDITPTHFPNCPNVPFAPERIQNVGLKCTILPHRSLKQIQHTLNEWLITTGRTPKRPSVLLRNFMWLSKDIYSGVNQLHMQWYHWTSSLHLVVAYNDTNLVIFFRGQLLLISIEHMRFCANGIPLFRYAIKRACSFINTEVAYI